MFKMPLLPEVPELPELLAYYCQTAAAIWYNTIPVASLTNDSPSMSMPNFLEAPNSLSKATTAIGSVQETMLPHIKAPFIFNYV